MTMSLLFTANTSAALNRQQAARVLDRHLADVVIRYANLPQGGNHIFGQPAGAGPPAAAGQYLEKSVGRQHDLR